MRYTLVFSIYLFFLSFACFGQEIDKIRNSSWLSVDYIKQMKNHLPCECADSVNYCYYISVAPKNINDRLEEYEDSLPEVIINYIIQTEARGFYITYSDFNKYVIFGEDEKWKNKTFELKLKNDTLLLIDSSNYKKFVKSELPFDYYATRSYYYNNIILLDKALSLRGYPSIQTILKDDSLHFSCNAWLNNLNIINSYKNRKWWILEIIDGYLYIRKIIKQVDPQAPIKTKVFKILKWDKDNKTGITKQKKIKVFETNKFVQIDNVLD